MAGNPSVGLTAAGAAGPDQSLRSLGKVILDLTELVRLVPASLPAAKPWQRQLIAELSDADRLIQVLRMTVSMERPDHEIREAAMAVRVACRKASATAASSRSDATTKAAAKLIADMATRMHAGVALGRAGKD